MQLVHSVVLHLEAEQLLVSGLRVVAPDSDQQAFEDPDSIVADLTVQ